MNTPTFRIELEDGTHAHVVTAELMTADKKHLEKISGLKYHNNDVEIRTSEIIGRVRNMAIKDERFLAYTIRTAEAVLINEYVKRYTSYYLLFDTSENEYLIYVLDKNGYDYVIRITRMVFDMFNGVLGDSEEYFLSASINIESLKRYYRACERIAVEEEEYEKAAHFRDLGKELLHRLNTSELNKAA